MYPAKRVHEDMFSNVSMQTLAARRTALPLTSVADSHIKSASAEAQQSNFGYRQREEQQTNRELAERNLF